MALLRRLIRFPLVLVLVLLGVVAIRLGLLWDRGRGRGLHQGAGRAAQRWWSRSMCRLLGLRLRVLGEPLAAGGVLLVSNHVSWLDIVCQAAVWPVGFLSKSEVRSWPLIGAVATGVGTLYIERGKRDGAARAAAAMSERLRRGHPVMFYPEGTTSDGSGLLPFRPRLYQAALDAEVPIQPAVIVYLEHGALSRRAPFIDDDGLLEHLWRVLGAARVEVLLQLGPELPVAGRGRSELALESREYIAKALEYLRP